MAIEPLRLGSIFRASNPMATMYFEVYSEMEDNEA